VCSGIALFSIFLLLFFIFIFFVISSLFLSSFIYHFCCDYMWYTKLAAICFFSVHYVFCILLYLRLVDEGMPQHEDVPPPEVSEDDQQLFDLAMQVRDQQ